MTHSYKKLEDLAPLLPQHSHSVTGAPTEPISLIIIGHKQLIKNMFLNVGWYQADRLNPLSMIRAAAAGLLNMSYRSGPFSPAYIHKAPQVGFERPTGADTFRRRHHIRLWRTGYLFDKLPVWVGTCSYDRSIGLQKNHLVPTHHINPNLGQDLKLLQREFSDFKPSYLKLASAETGVISNGDRYQWDGRALVINTRHEA